jgi:hypothetical protein
LRDHRGWFPTDAQREEARRHLPYFAGKEFNDQLADSRHPKPGSLDLPKGILKVTYALGDKEEKSIEFRNNAIVVTVHHAGEFTEIVPLLQAGDDPPVGSPCDPRAGHPLPEPPPNPGWEAAISRWCAFRRRIH